MIGSRLFQHWMVRSQLSLEKFRTPRNNSQLDEICLFVHSRFWIYLKLWPFLFDRNSKHKIAHFQWRKQIVFSISTDAYYLSRVTLAIKNANEKVDTRKMRKYFGGLCMHTGTTQIHYDLCPSTKNSYDVLSFCFRLSPWSANAKSPIHAERPTKQPFSSNGNCDELYMYASLTQCSDMKYVHVRVTNAYSWWCQDVSHWDIQAVEVLVDSSSERPSSATPWRCVLRKRLL